MIVTFPFEDDPYYSAPQPASYPQSASAALSTPALVRKYIDLAKHVAGGVFPVGRNRFWHGGVHLSGKKPVRAVADGTIVAFRLDRDYIDSELDRQIKAAAPVKASASKAKPQPSPPRQFSSSFVLIRHECEVNRGGGEMQPVGGVSQGVSASIPRYIGAHFYSLYANLLPQKQLQNKAVLPPFLTTTNTIVPVAALRGDEVTVSAVIDDGHHMVKIRITDINTRNSGEGWIERMYLDVEPGAPLRPEQKIRLGYPISFMYCCHPTEKRWMPLDCTFSLEYPVRAGQVIGYAGITDGDLGSVADSFHFEIFTGENKLVKQMKPLVPLNISDPSSSYQEYADGQKSDGMGKVWLTRNANLARFKSLVKPGRLAASNMQQFPSGSCFLGAIPCGVDGTVPTQVEELICFKLFGMDGSTYYAYADQVSAAADGREFVRDAWVTLTTDSDWVARGWQTYEDSELNTTDDGFVEDDDAVMQKILSAAHKSSASLSLDDLHADGVDAILRTAAVRFHTEWDSSNNSKRYDKLQQGGHPPLPQLSDSEFKAFLHDIQHQQFWSNAKVQQDGVNNAMKPLSTPMDTKNWHFHPVGFLAQMRECLATDATLSEEAFELEIRQSWITCLKLIEKRLKQLEPWADANAAMPDAPSARAPVVREYATLQTIHNVAHHDLWSNFEYWFGVTPNDIAAPETLHGQLAAKPAGHHVHNYLKGMREFFRHISMQRVVKGALGFEAGAYVQPGLYPVKALKPAQSGFRMEYVNIACQYGPFFRSFNNRDPVDQNRMEIQLHEVAHLQNTAHAQDQKIDVNGAHDPDRYNGKTAYGARAARVLAEFTPNRALANAESIAFFIESAKDET